MQAGVDGRDPPAERAVLARQHHILSSERARPRLRARARRERNETHLKTCCHLSTPFHVQLSIHGCTTAHGANGGPKSPCCSAWCAYASMRAALSAVAPRPHVSALRAVSGSKVRVRYAERLTGRQGSETRCGRRRGERDQKACFEEATKRERRTHARLGDPAPVARGQRFGRHLQGCTTESATEEEEKNVGRQGRRERGGREREGGTHEPRVHDLSARQAKNDDADVLDADPALGLEVVVPALEPAHEELLADRDAARGLLGDDRQARDEAGDGGVPGLEVRGAERARVVEAERVQGPLAARRAGRRRGSVRAHRG